MLASLAVGGILGILIFVLVVLAIIYLIKRLF
jgi:hypothetical protein